MDDEIVSLVKEIEGNIEFLENLVKRNNLIIGTAGILAVVVALVLLVR